MMWNHALHLIAGVLGANYMTWSASGVLASVALAFITQAIDMIRLHFYFRKRFLATPEYIRENTDLRWTPPSSPRYWYKSAQLYVAKVIWYGFVTLVAAQIMRFLNA